MERRGLSTGELRTRQLTASGEQLVVLYPNAEYDGKNSHSETGDQVWNPVNAQGDRREDDGPTEEKRHPTHRKRVGKARQADDDAGRRMETGEGIVQRTDRAYGLNQPGCPKVRQHDGAGIRKGPPLNHRKEQEKRQADCRYTVYR